LLTAFAFIQFPESNAIYALYMVPFAASALAVWTRRSSTALAISGVLLLISSIVAIQSERGYLYLATPLADPVELVTLDVDRGGIEIPKQHHFYVDLVKHLESHGGTAIYAGPDSPEVYFLSATANPTPVLFDFLADDWDIEDLEQLVRGGELSAVVVNRSPDFSSALAQETLETIESAYPDRTSFGWFEVHEGPGSDVP
jgi:hypothetical protein